MAGAFNTTLPNPGDRGAKLEPIMAQTAGGNAVEPWPDNITYIYTGQMFFPDNGAADGISEYAFAEHVDDSTQIKIDGVERLNNTVWNAVNTTGRQAISSGWHDVEFRFGQGNGGAGPSTDTAADADPNNPWDLNLGLGVDFITPIQGDLKQPNYQRPVDPGNSTVFRTATYSLDTSQDNQNVIVNSNATLNVFQGRTVPFGTLTVANGVTFTMSSPGGPSTFTSTNIGATATFDITGGNVVTGPLKSTGAVTSITKTGAGVLNIPTSAGSTVTSNPAVNVNGGTLSIGVGSAGTSVGTGPINLSSGTLGLANDPLVANGPGVFNVTGDFHLHNEFEPIITGVPNSANGFGWSGLDNKANLDSSLTGKTPTAVREVNMPINFPRGDGNLIDGGGNDVETELFNIDGANLGVPIRGDNVFIARFTGKLNVTTTGPTRFGMASNDGSVLFIDMDQGAGTNWVKVADNNRYAATTEGNFQEHGNTGQAGTDPGTPAIPQPAVPTLNAGVYDFAIGWFNWTDPDEPPPQAGIEMYWVPSGGTRGIVPYAAGGPVTLANTLTVSGVSGLNVQAPSATLTDLRMNPGSSLAVSGNQLTTAIRATGAGTVSVGAVSGPDVRITTLNDGGNAVLFAAGPGRATLTGPPGPSFGPTSSVGAVPVRHAGGDEHRHRLDDRQRPGHAGRRHAGAQLGAHRDAGHAIFGRSVCVNDGWHGCRRGRRGDHCR